MSGSKPVPEPVPTATTGVWAHMAGVKGAVLVVGPCPWFEAWVTIAALERGGRQKP
jgi:hypothetical protein